MSEHEHETVTIEQPARRRGMSVERRFTTAGHDPYDSVTWSKRTSRIANPDGTVVFEMADAEIPVTWSQVAADIMVSKYFRKAGVPQVDAEGAPILNEHGTQQTGPERSARQVIHRLAGCWRWWGEEHGYFNTEEDAQAFYDELAYMLVHQMAAPNSPQWFNTGLNYAYGITGPAQGHYYVVPETGEVRLSEDAYTHPQPHACQPYDALISTPAGPVRIGDIVTGNRVGLEVYDGTAGGAGTTRVVAVKANGEKSVYRIVLKNGATVEATPDHLVFVRDVRKGLGRWARVDEVQPGQRMVVSTRTRVEAESDPTAVAEAALAGWLQGDGFVGQYETGTNRSLTLEFMTINDDEMRAVIGWVEQVFPGHHYRIRAVESKSDAIDVRRIRLYGEGLRPFVLKYGLLRNGLDHEVPAAIQQGGAECQRAYLRSLFQADGCVRLRHKSSGRAADVVLTSISPNLVGGVQTLLLNDGIYSRISTGVDKRENRRTPYQLSIGYADARQRFADTIGFISTEKQDKLAVALSDEFAGKRLPGLREEIVARIEIKGFEPVFDIQTESGQYLSNNVLVHNCFIQSVNDDLVGEGGIMDLWVREARLFKYGSGTGTNFSTLRGEGEKLSGGGTSSGLMSFLRVGDRAAGAIKSGGTTRRAAKMVCLNVDHPDIEAFVTWKADEEKKVEALIAAGYPSDYNGEAYSTISGQNANNSVRVTNDFIKAVQEDADWDLIRRTDGQVHKTIKARALWQTIAEAAWRSADPGLQYDTTINEWHTSPESGRINASNPCSEYLFLDNTACNLASLNLMKFVNVETGEVDIEAYRHAVRLWTIVLEISVLMAQFPSKEIARLSYDFRTLGLGYANIGTVLMIRGLPYDSDEARAFTSAMTAIMTGESYATSAEMARHLGPFPGYEANERPMLRVIRNHRRAAYDAPKEEYEGLSVLPMPLNAELAPAGLVRAAREAWDRALAGGELYGYRNAQTTLLAPTGTIGLLMDCDTTGVEPDFALVKFKKLAGGGYFKIANQSIKSALRNLGYSADERREIMTYVLGTLSLEGAPFINRSTLRERGFTDADLSRVEAALPGVFELGFAFSAWTLGEETLSHVGVTMAEASQPGFELLRKLGFSRAQIDAANEHICGTMTVEGAPHLKDEHLPVFDTANRCGKKGTRFIQHMGHIKMMAAAQSFLSGAISKTINMPTEATVEDIIDAYHQSWIHGLKAMALYRDGSKSSQPLSSKSDTKIDLDESVIEEKVAAAVAAARTEWREEQSTAVARAVQEARAQWEAEQAAMAGLPATRPVDLAGVSALSTPMQLGFVEQQTRAVRRRLPARRRGFTQEARVAGQKVFLRTGEYDDGSLGEIFIDVAKEGAAFRSMINCFAISISKGLQYGVPLEEYVDTFTFVRFEPQGMVTGHPNIKTATSMIDYVFRVLAFEYLNRTDLVHVAPDELQSGPGGADGVEESGSALFPNWTSPARVTTVEAGAVPGPGAPDAIGSAGNLVAGSRSEIEEDGAPTVPLTLDEPTAAMAEIAMEPAVAAEPPVAPAAVAQPPALHAHDMPVRHGAINGSNGHGHNGQVATNGNGHSQAPAAIQAPPMSALDAALGHLMGDAPFCDVCGHITVRNGACYKCLNCGNSLGCS